MQRGGHPLGQCDGGGGDFEWGQVEKVGGGPRHREKPALLLDLPGAMLGLDDERRRHHSHRDDREHPKASRRDLMGGGLETGCHDGNAQT
jgi:hypothetical protein